MNVLFLSGAVILWGAVHSFLASASVKRLAERVLGDTGARAYRLGYNAFAAISFVPILALVRFLPDRTIYAITPPWQFALILGQALAVVCLLLALLQTDPLHFIGIRQLVEKDSTKSLVATGFYGLVRHPLYLFGLLILWLTPLMTANLLTVFVVLTVYIFVGAALEEHRLLKEFGAAYAEYRASTPMIIPSLTPGRRSAHKPDRSG